MSYTPTSPPGIALAQLRRMVSLSTTFQDAMGAADETAALEFILIGMRPYATDLPDGGAVLYLAEQPVNFDLQAGGEQLWLHPTGGIVCQLVLKQEDVEPLEDLYMRGVDFAGNVASDVKALSDAEDTGTAFGANHLAITKIAAEYAGPANPQFNHSRGLMFLSKLFIDWGIN